MTDAAADDPFASDFADLVGFDAVHRRRYEARGFHVGGDTLLIRGVVDDEAPPHVTIPGDDRPLQFHHMVVDVRVDIVTTVIESVEVRFDTHPHATCPTIAAAYQQLVGSSMARGYTNRVKELFGGPRGCTHVVALLQAMAPVLAQARWPMLSRLHAGEAVHNPDRPPPDPEQRRMLARANLNTCHMWAEDGELMTQVDQGAAVPVPSPILRRMRELGVDPDVWTQRTQPGRRAR